MRIMEIISGATTNGAIIHCLLLARELVRRGNQVTLVCRPGAWIGEQLEADGVEVIHSHLNRWPLGELRRIAGVCRSREIDVIHTHMSRAHFFGVLLRWFSRVPCVATAHNRLIQPFWMFNDRVIANSDATRRFHRRFNLVGARRIDTVHCFVDYERFAAVPDSVGHDVRAELGLTEDQLLIGQIGQVCPRKGLLFTVRALPKVIAQFPHARLVIVGAYDHPKYLKYVAQVRRESKRLDVAGHMLWTGPRDDVPEILTALDLFVQPSLEEAQGIAALEAMVRRVPVLATRVGGVREMVQHGETGWLVPPADPDALATGISKLVTDPALRGRLVARGHEMVKNRFSPASQVPHVEAVFAAAASGRKAA
jgi:glycosyltransferase involved in cell wall biosynthesis